MSREITLTEPGDYDDIRDELREEIKSLKSDIKRQVAQAIEDSKSGSIRVDIQRDDVAQAEPSFLVVKDLVRQIRDDVRASLTTRGEMAVDELVDRMPTDKASDLLKSLASEERLKIVKLLYSSRKTFSDFKNATKLEGGSVKHHLDYLLNSGLVTHGDEGGYELTRRGRTLVRTLALMNEALGGEKVD